MRLRLVILLLAFLVAGASAQTPDAQALVKQLAAERLRLGACNAELGPLQQLSSLVLTGEVQKASQTVDQVRARVEVANPGQTIDPVTWKIVPTLPMPASPAK